MLETAFDFVADFLLDSLEGPGRKRVSFAQAEFRVRAWKVRIELRLEVCGAELGHAHWV